MNGYRKVTVLDCTLRDAGYPINFQFTAEDAAVIAAALEAAGVTMIEVGHGLGLGASNRKDLGAAAASDREYFAAVADVLQRARFGAFLIPGIGTLEDLEGAAKSGAGFIRIGVDVTRTDAAEPFVRRAKDLGLEVSVNLMKTYAVSEDEALRRSEPLADLGADVIAVVDSAGGMFPHEVGSYVRRLNENLDAAVGFHGHNNMQLAVANCIAAVDAGAAVVDTTLCGMGRSLGNAATEVIALVLQKQGFETGIDPLKTLDVAEKLVAPYMTANHADMLDLVFGYSKFHSGFYPLVRKAAEHFGVDPRQLVMRLSEIDIVNVTEEMAFGAAEELSKARAAQARADANRHTVFQWSRDSKIQEKGVAESASEAAAEVFNLATKTKRLSIFTVAFAPGAAHATRFPFIRADATKVVGNAELADARDIERVVKALDGKVDVIMVDTDTPRTADGHSLLKAVQADTERSRVLPYSDVGARLQSTEALVRAVCRDVSGCRIAICGVDTFAVELALRLMRAGACVFLHDTDSERLKAALKMLHEYTTVSDGDLAAPHELREQSAKSVNVLIGTGVRQPLVGTNLIEWVVDGGMIIDAGAGSLDPGALAAAHARGLVARRVDVRAGLFAEVDAALATADLVETAQGARTLDGVPIVSGGLIGARGTVVVDDMARPTRIVGVADGSGTLLEPDDAAAFASAARRVRQAILRSRLP